MTNINLKCSSMYSLFKVYQLMEWTYKRKSGQGYPDIVLYADSYMHSKQLFIPHAKYVAFHCFICILKETWSLKQTKWSEDKHNKSNFHRTQNTHLKDRLIPWTISFSSISFWTSDSSYSSSCSSFLTFSVLQSSYWTSAMALKYG